MDHISSLLFWQLEFVIFALIFLLFSGGFPGAVFRRVRAIVIEAIDPFAFWRFSYISKESFKRIEPTVANINASTSIVFEMWLLRIVTTLFHGFPNSMSPRPRLSMSGMRSLNEFFREQTTTGFSMPVYKIFCCDQSLISTSALTNPTNPTVFMIWAKS